MTINFKPSPKLLGIIQMYLLNLTVETSPFTWTWELIQQLKQTGLQKCVKDFSLFHTWVSVLPARKPRAAPPCYSHKPNRGVSALRRCVCAHIMLVSQNQLSDRVVSFPMPTWCVYCFACNYLPCWVKKILASTPRFASVLSHTARCASRAHHCRLIIWMHPVQKRSITEPNDEW